MLLGTFLIFLSVIDIEVRIPRPVIYLGKISYGLYLFHAFILWLLFDTVGLWPRMIFFQRHKFLHPPRLRSHRRDRRILLSLLRAPHPQI